MALSEDSRALLQLLLGKGQSYADIADLLGVSEDEVRSRARAALTEMSDQDPDANAPLTDYLLGQADPITRADVARHLSEDAGDQELADTLSAQLRLLAPSAKLPKANRPGIAAPRKSARSGKGRSNRSPEAGGGTKRSKPGPDLTIQQRRLIALLLGAALLITIIVLLVSGAFDGSGENTSAVNPDPTTATLAAVEGQTGSGQAEFGFSGANLAANLQFDDLEPSETGESYTTWITGPKGVAYPINQTPVGEDGTISGQVAINQAIICFVAADAFTDMKVSRVTNDEMRATLAEAGTANKGSGDFPAFVGEPVMQGPIQMPAEAKKQVLPSCNGDNGSGATTP